MSRQKRMAFPTSLKLWNTSVFSSAYSMISLSWWWKNSRIPGKTYSHDYLANSMFLFKKNNTYKVDHRTTFLFLQSNIQPSSKRPLIPQYVIDNLLLQGGISMMSAGLRGPGWPTFGRSIRPSQHMRGGSLTADSKITDSKPGTELRVQNVSNLRITKPSS